ncbi:hypothetical protein D9M70_651410 [compost metagenome]
MAGHRFLLVAGDLAIGKAGEVVVALVVLLHMFEAEHEVLALGIAADGRFMHALLIAAVPLTNGRSRLRPGLNLAPGANAIEVF